MRTTIDLPDHLFRKVKAQAALEGRKLKDLISEYVERGLMGDSHQEDLPSSKPTRRRSPLPAISKASATSEPIPALTNAQIEAILDAEDAERAG